VERRKKALSRAISNWQLAKLSRSQQRCAIPRHVAMKKLTVNFLLTLDWELL